MIRISLGTLCAGSYSQAPNTKIMDFGGVFYRTLTALRMVIQAIQNFRKEEGLLNFKGHNK
jgi:hypothetical protein